MRSLRNDDGAVVVGGVFGPFGLERVLCCTGVQDDAVAFKDALHVAVAHGDDAHGGVLPPVGAPEQRESALVFRRAFAQRQRFVRAIGLPPPLAGQKQRCVQMPGQAVRKGKGANRQIGNLFILLGKQIKLVG